MLKLLNEVQAYYIFTEKQLGLGLSSR